MTGTRSGGVPTVLVVDRDADQHDLIRGMLRGQSIRVCSAFRGHDAVQWVLSDRVDLILFASFDPEGLQRQCWDALAAQHVQNVVPTILYGPLPQDEGEAIARSLGAREFLRKPFRKAVLLEVVFRHLCQDVS